MRAKRPLLFLPPAAVLPCLKHPGDIVIYRLFGGSSLLSLTCTILNPAGRNRAMKQLRRALSALLLTSWRCACAEPCRRASRKPPPERLTDGSSTPRAVCCPASTVTAKSPDTGFARTVVTNESMASTALPLMPPGTLRDQGGARRASPPPRRKVQLTVGSTLTVNQTLRVDRRGGDRHRRRARAHGRNEQPTITDHDHRTQRPSTNLPINGRRFQDFVTLTPTVQVDTSRGQLSFAGQRGINANVSIDGADYNQPFFGGIRGGERSNIAFTIPQEAIKEFQVVAAGYSAEFGRSTGGLVNAITKSGTNTLHGSAVLREPQQGLGREERVRPERRADAAAVRRLARRPDRRPTSCSSSAPTSSRRSRTAQRRCSISSPASRRAPTRRRRSTSTSALEEPFDATNDAWALLGRVDEQLSDGTASTSATAAAATAPKRQRARATRSSRPRTQRAVEQRHREGPTPTPSSVSSRACCRPNMLLEVARAVLARKSPARRQRRDADAADTVGNVRRAQLPADHADRLARAERGEPDLDARAATTSRSASNTTTTFADQVFGFNQFGAFNISGTRDAVLELMSLGGTTANRFDCSRRGTYQRQIGNLELSIRDGRSRVLRAGCLALKPNFTINCGLRWEGQFNPTPDVNNDFLSQRGERLQLPARPHGRSAQIPDQPNQWGPRVGFAWDPFNDGKTVVRGYSGLYYARTPSIALRGADEQLPPAAGDVSIALPFAVPAGNPNDTRLRAVQADRHRPEHVSAGQPAGADAGAGQQIGAALGIVAESVPRARRCSRPTRTSGTRSAVQYGVGVEREMLTGHRRSAPSSAGEDGVSAAQPQPEPAGVPVIRRDRSGAAAVLRSVATPRPIATLGSVRCANRRRAPTTAR